jgi:hypothetical protein
MKRPQRERPGLGGAIDARSMTTTGSSEALTVPQSRWASLARAAYGVALICAPGRLIMARTRLRPSGRACAVGRVLGARHLAQALICGATPTPRLIRAGVAVDLLHAASMLALAAENADVRSALLTDASIAAAFAGAGSAFLQTGHAASRSATGTWQANY